MITTSTKIGMVCGRAAARARVLLAVRPADLVEVVVVVACAVAAAVPVGAVRAQSAGGLPWSASRPLAWSDFRGPVDRDAPPETVAMTAASLNWTYGYQLERGARACFYRITDITTEALFHPEDSWVRPEHRNAGVLEHEQGHFDLTQVHKLMLDEEVGKLIGSARDCGRRGADLSRVESKVAADIQPLRERIWADLQRVQRRYDAETRHGIRTDVQREWTVRIDEALRRGRWK